MCIQKSKQISSTSVKETNNKNKKNLFDTKYAPKGFYAEPGDCLGCETDYCYNAKFCSYLYRPDRTMARLLKKNTHIKKQDNNVMQIDKNYLSDYAIKRLYPRYENRVICDYYVGPYTYLKKIIDDASKNIGIRSESDIIVKNIGKDIGIILCTIPIKGYYLEQIDENDKEKILEKKAILKSVSKKVRYRLINNAKKYGILYLGVNNKKMQKDIPIKKTGYGKDQKLFWEVKQSHLIINNL